MPRIRAKRQDNTETKFHQNKGIKLATGRIVGTLNADDRLADNDVIQAIVQAFTQTGTDIIYGNLNVIKPDGNISRKWVSNQCGKKSFNWGFMPPHPTFYCKTELFEKVGFYSLEYGSAADYELMLRFMYAQQVSCFYVNKVLVNMLAGGVSNRSFKNRMNAWAFDLKAMRVNGIKRPILALVFKPLRKAHQFFK